MIVDGIRDGRRELRYDLRRASSPTADRPHHRLSDHVAQPVVQQHRSASPEFSGWNWVAASVPFSTAATKSSPWWAQVTSGGRTRSDGSSSQRRTAKECTK